MPAPWSTKTKSKPATVCLQAQVSFAIFCISFCQGKQPLCIDIQTKTGPTIAFELCRVIRTESEHKNLLLSCHVTHLMAALQDKPCLTTHHLEKELYFTSGNGRRSFSFRLNYVKTYVNCDSAQSFINCTSNTIP